MESRKHAFALGRCTPGWINAAYVSLGNVMLNSCMSKYSAVDHFSTVVNSYTCGSCMCSLISEMYQFSLQELKKTTTTQLAIITVSELGVGFC